MNDRVQLRVATLLNTGVVAETSRGFLIVAMDSFSWLQLSHEDAMCADIKSYSGDEFIVNGAASVTGVVDFSYTETVKPVATGMLTGVRDQTILNGQMPSYYAHYAKPALIADNNRLRSGNQLYTEKTFSCGDVLYWCGDSTGMTRASVLRVLYKPHTRGTTGRKREQTRKFCSFWLSFSRMAKCPRRTATPWYFQRRGRTGRVYLYTQLVGGACTMTQPTHVRSQ